MMVRFTPLLCMTWTVLLLGCVARVSATSTSVKAVISWAGQGQVFHIATGTRLFLGSFEGVIYVETAEGDMHEGFVRCPVSQQINTETMATAGSGYCMIIVEGGETIFAQWSCAGKVGGCQGEFTITGGTGRFEHITGASPLVIRSPLRVLISDMSSGSTLQVDHGIAMLTDLTYQIPAGHKRQRETKN